MPSRGTDNRVNRADLVTRRPQTGRAYGNQSASSNVTSHQNELTSSSHSQHNAVTSTNQSYQNTVTSSSVGSNLRVSRTGTSTSTVKSDCCCSSTCCWNCMMCHTSQDDNDRNAREPGGRELWVRMISWLAVVEILGCICLFLGSTLLTNSLINNDDDYQTTAAIAACLMVAGALLMGGGLILGKLFISNKWRKTTQSAEVDGVALSTVNRDVGLSNDATPATHETTFILSSPVSLMGLPSYEQVLAEDQTSHPCDHIIVNSSTTESSPTAALEHYLSSQSDAPEANQSSTSNNRHSSRVASQTSSMLATSGDSNDINTTAVNSSTSNNTNSGGVSSNSARGGSNSVRAGSSSINGTSDSYIHPPTYPPLETQYEPPPPYLE